MKNLLAGLFLLFSVSLFSQELGDIDAQRPTLTESYSIINPNLIQFENGIDWTTSPSYSTFIRGSVTNWTELRMSTDWQGITAVGAKFVISEPEATQYGVGGSFVYGYNIQDSCHDFRLAMTKNFGPVFFTYNLGWANQVYNIFLVGLPIGNQNSWFGEWYYQDQTNRFHTGFTWIPTTDVQLDINGGYSQFLDDFWYAGIGASFRLK